MMGPQVYTCLDIWAFFFFLPILIIYLFFFAMVDLGVNAFGVYYKADVNGSYSGTIIT